MRALPVAAIFSLGLLATQPADATVTLLATGTLTGSSAGANADLSGLTGNLEDGSAANLLGGLGSGLAWAGGNTFVATPDRGPNASTYNPLVDNTTSYIARLQTVGMVLTPNAPGSAQPFSLTPSLLGTTLLYNTTPLNYGTGAGLSLGSGAPAANTAGKFYFTGRSDNFSGSGSTNTTNARFDPEGVRISRDGTKAYVSDEYGPYVYEFDRATGQRTRTFTLPAHLAVTALSPQGSVETATNTSGRTDNKGMEGLAITPDGKTLIGIMQAPLIQDALQNPNSKLLRLVTIDVATGLTTHEYAYNLTDGSGVSEIVALNDHEFLVDERDGRGLGSGNDARQKKVFKIDLTNAVDVSGMDGITAAANAVAKTQFLDLVALLNGGPNNIAKTQIPSKIEGLAIGDDIDVNGTLTHTLWVANDNDFIAGTAGPNRFYVVGFTDADLGTTRLELQAIPEPGTAALLGLGIIGLVGRLRRRR